MIYRAIVALCAVAFLALMTILLLATLARAHGDYAWIMREHPECCGPADCFRVSPVDPVPGGYRVQGEFVPEAETRPSRDGYHWRCYHGTDLSRPRKGCLFISPGGS